MEPPESAHRYDQSPNGVRPALSAPSELSEFLEDDTDQLRSHQQPSYASTTPSRRSKSFYIVIALLLFSLAVSLWTSHSSKRAAAQCPDCNCGREGGVPPLSKEGAEAMLGTGLSLFTLQLILCVFATYILVQNQLIYLPACIAYVLLGILVGSLVRVSGATDALGLSLPNQEQFFTFILPPIILEAGYSLNKRNFFGEGLGIFLLALPGTVISALVFGLGIYTVGLFSVSYYFSFWEAMTFGALLSAVDPVATIAIFSALKVDKTLHFLVFGESVLNDAVAIVLYRTFSRLIGSTITTFYHPLFNFFYVFFGSVVIGAALGAATSLVLKHTNLHRSPSLEFSFYLLMAYLPYPVCDGLSMSGILGILVSSVMLAHYAHYNLSKVTQISAQQVFRSLAFLAETFVFVYLGTALTSFNHSWHIQTIAWGIVFTLVSRAANVYPLTNLLNRWRTDKISRKTQFIMWFSGSLRGAIAWALSLSLPSRNGSDDTRRVVISSTLAIVLFTVIVLGGGMLPLLRLLHIEEGRENDSDDNAPEETEQTHDEVSRLATRLQRIDETWVKPFLLASSTRVMVATNRTLQTLAVSDVERLTPHELGSLLDSSAAIDLPFPTVEEEMGEEVAVVVHKGDLMPDEK